MEFRFQFVNPWPVLGGGRIPLISPLAYFHAPLKWTFPPLPETFNKMQIYLVRGDSTAPPAIYLAWVMLPIAPPAFCELDTSMSLNIVANCAYHIRLIC